MPLAVALLAAAILHEPFTDAKKPGFVLILLGVFAIAWNAGGAVGSGQTIGHALFLGSAVAWACYTVAMRRARLDGLHAAAIAAVGALFLYMPVYFAWRVPASPRPPGETWRFRPCAGASDGDCFTGFLRTGGQPPRRLQRRRVRSAVPGADGRHGHSNSG